MIGERLRAAARRLAAIEATPFYVFDLDAVAATYTAMTGAWRRSFPRFTAAYSYKTNPLRAVTGLLRELGAGAEVVSGAELRAALEDGFAPGTVYFDGPVKRPDELAEALEHGVRVQVDSLDEVDRLALHTGTIRVGLRLAMPKGRRRWSRFGLLPDEVGVAVRRLAAAGIAVDGAHFNVGAHALSPKPYVAAIEAWAGTLRAMAAAAPGGPFVLDVGGGFPARSAGPDVRLPAWDDYALAVAGACERAGLSPARLHLVIEPGRSLVEDHAVLVSRVAVRKRRAGRSIVVLDAGTNLTRSVNAWHHPVEFLSPGRTPHTVYGAMCYESDLFADGVPGPAEVRVGDVVVIGSAGGYDIPSANVWVRPHPPIFAVRAGQTELARAAGETVRA